eukprot:SAG11_NODE_9629_length_894_cov_8.561006_1_plen_98_part_10
MWLCPALALGKQNKNVKLLLIHPVIRILPGILNTLAYDNIYDAFASVALAAHASACQLLRPEAAAAAAPRGVGGKAALQLVVQAQLICGHCLGRLRIH